MVLCRLPLPLYFLQTPSPDVPWAQPVDIGAQARNSATFVIRGRKETFPCLSPRKEREESWRRTESCNSFSKWKMMNISQKNGFVFPFLHWEIPILTVPLSIYSSGLRRYHWSRWTRLTKEYPCVPQASKVDQKSWFRGLGTGEHPQLPSVCLQDNVMEQKLESQKMAAFNLGVSEAIKQKNLNKEMDFQVSKRKIDSKIVLKGEKWDKKVTHLSKQQFAQVGNLRVPEQDFFSIPAIICASKEALHSSQTCQRRKLLQRLGWSGERADEFLSRMKNISDYTFGANHNLAICSEIRFDELKSCIRSAWSKTKTIRHQKLIRHNRSFYSWASFLQVTTRAENIKKTKADEEFLEKMEQVQLAEE